MKNLKFMALGVAVGLCMLSAFGQGTGRLGQPDVVAEMTQKLNLTKAQQAKIRAIVQDENTKIGRIHNSPTASHNIEKRDAEERKVAFDESARMTAVLTPEQRRKWSGLPSTPLQRKLDQLGLDASQQHKIAALINEMNAKMEAAPDNQLRTRVHEIRNEYRARIEAVLTPAQKQKFEAGR